MNRQYNPDLFVKYAPRVTRRLRAAVNRICEANDMPEADVLRYSFEAAVLTKKLKRSTSADPAPLDAMMTVRTTRAIGRRVHELWMNNPNVLKANILRALLENMLSVAESRGMAHVMKLREEALDKAPKTERRITTHRQRLERKG